MIVIKERKKLNNKYYRYIYSDEGYYIQDENGNEYEDVYDPLNSDRIYIETNIKVED